MSQGESDRKERDEVEPEVIEAHAEIVEAPEDATLAPLGDDRARAPGPIAVIERYRLAQLRSKKELEAVEIILDSKLDEMRQAAAAATAESKARWDARTAEVVSAMKTVVQAQLRGVENERLAHRFDSIEKAYGTFAAKVREVESGPLPEELQADLIVKLREHLTATIERLESDAIADGYDLKD